MRTSHSICSYRGPIPAANIGVIGGGEPRLTREAYCAAKLGPGVRSSNVGVDPSEKGGLSVTLRQRVARSSLSRSVNIRLHRNTRRLITLP